MTRIHRCLRLRGLPTSILAWSVGLTILGGVWSLQAAEENGKRRPEVVAVYYPHWHNYDHGNAWKGEGWSEWEGLQAAVPRFPGHHQPLKPSLASRGANRHGLLGGHPSGDAVMVSTPGHARAPGNFSRSFFAIRLAPASQRLRGRAG